MSLLFSFVPPTTSMLSYNCTVYFSCCSFSLTSLKLLVLCLLLVMEHVCHLVFLQVQHRSWHTTWIDAPEILLVPRNTLPVHFTASPEFRVHSHSLEFFSSCIPLRNFLASVPASELSLMRKVNTAYRGWMPIAMLKCIITEERFSSVGNHKDNNLVCVNFFFCVIFCEITEDGILQARILECAAFPFSKGSAQPTDRTQLSHTAGTFFTSWTTREAQGDRHITPFR